MVRVTRGSHSCTPSHERKAFGFTQIITHKDLSRQISKDISTLQPKHHKHNIMKLFFLLAFFFAFLTTAIAAEEDVTLETAAELPIDLEKHDLDILEEAVEPTLEDRRLGYYNCKYVGPTYEGGKCLKIKYCLNSWAGKWYKVKAKSLPWADCWKKNGHKKNDSSSSSSSSDKDCKKWKRKYKDCKKKHSKSKCKKKSYYKKWDKKC